MPVDPRLLTFLDLAWKIRCLQYKYDNTVKGVETCRQYSRPEVVARREADMDKDRAELEEAIAAADHALDEILLDRLQYLLPKVLPTLNHHKLSD